MNKPLWLGIGATLAFLLSDSSGKVKSMSGLRKRRSRRLFYIRNDRVIPKAQVEQAKRQAKAGGACLHAVWAYNADEARDLIYQGKAESVCKVERISLGDKKLEIWEMTPAYFQAQAGVHQPWIMEIAPTQYARMSERQRKQYEEKRRKEWQASADVKDEWKKQVVKAYKEGRFDINDPSVSKEAKTALWAEAQRLEHDHIAQEEAKWNQANQISSINSVEVGDKIYSVLYSDYMEVVKKNPKSIKLRAYKSSKRFGTGEEYYPELKTDPSALRRYSPKDSEDLFFQYYKSLPKKDFLIPKPKQIKKKKELPEQASFLEPTQMTLFGTKRLRNAIHRQQNFTN